MISVIIKTAKHDLTNCSLADTADELQFCWDTNHFSLFMYKIFLCAYSYFPSTKTLLLSNILCQTRSSKISKTVFKALVVSDPLRIKPASHLTAFETIFLIIKLLFSVNINKQYLFTGFISRNLSERLSKLSFMGH